MTNPWEGFRLARPLTAEMLGQLPFPEPPRRSSLRVNGLPLRVADTPMMLRCANTSNFYGVATIELTRDVAASSVYDITLDVILRTEGEGGLVRRSAGRYSARVAVRDARPGKVLASWHLFQEATRRKPKGGLGIGPAYFKFELFVPEEI
jgi:hypothetical protein